MMTWNFNIIKKNLKILIDEMIGLCNYMFFAIKWVKWHGFNNLLIISCKCPF
jgi:hypothetical protein